MIDLTQPKIIKELLAEHGARPNKSLGQHFLISRAVIDKIIAAADLSSSDTVLEIGPGLGVLTLELSKNTGHVIAVDQDPNMIEILRSNLSNENIDNTKVAHSDILKLTSNDLHLTTYNLIANLPYQITSPILWKFLHEEKYKPSQMVIMIQREVAERIIAKPGDMSLLSVLTQYYTDSKVVCNVKPGQFYPPPKVDSTVIKLVTKEQGSSRSQEMNGNGDEKKFFDLVRAGFSSKRKMLKNNLKEKFGSNEESIVAALQKARLSEKSRAQELSVNDWIALHEFLYNN